MINCSGYSVEIESDGTQIKTSCRNFDDIKQLLKTQESGRISVVRRRDGSEIYCGPVDKAKWRFGVISGIQYRGADI